MITIRDSGQTLTAAQVETLTAKAQAYPFDIIVEIQTQYPLSRASFQNQVALRVTPGSRIISIGVDPRQHYTFVHSSAALGVPPGPQVAQAGNAFFKAGNLVDGIDAIAAKANELRVHTHGGIMTQVITLGCPLCGNIETNNVLERDASGFPRGVLAGKPSLEAQCQKGCFVQVQASVTTTQIQWPGKRLKLATSTDGADATPETERNT